MANPTIISIPEVELPEEQGYAPETGIVMECPVRLGLRRDGTQLWTLPVEPLVSARGRKNVILSNVLKKKRQGGIMELWSIDNYEVEIRGSLFSNQMGVYPAEQVARLKKLLEAEEVISIQSLVTDALGIRYVVFTDWEFPDTKNIMWQDYRIRALSDTDIELIESI